MRDRNKLNILELAFTVGLPLGVSTFSKLFAKNDLVRNYLADVLVPFSMYNFCRMKDESRAFSLTFSIIPWFGVEIAQAFKAYPGGVYDSYDFLAYTLGGTLGLGIDKARSYLKREKSEKTN